MKLFVILSRSQVGVHRSDILLEQACQARGIEYVRLVHDEMTIDDAPYLDVEPGSLLYRIHTDSQGLALESVLATVFGEELTTIYKYEPRLYPRRLAYSEIPMQMGAGLPVIPTRLVDALWRGMSDNELNDRLKKVGGFPVILKTLGKSHGQGVVKIDTLEQLRAELSTRPLEENNVLIRQYLADYRHFRLVVVDGKVMAPIEYHVPEDDFRTNASETPSVSVLQDHEVDQSIVDMAMKAVELRVSLLGGVDILVDQTTGTPYIAEVNVPCYFPRSQDASGIDIAGAIVDALVKKGGHNG